MFAWSTPFMAAAGPATVKICFYPRRPSMVIGSIERLAKLSDLLSGQSHKARAPG
jgi:hypothetical protein